MSRFTPSRPDGLVASIVALSQQSNRLALDAAMEAARADALGNVATAVDQVCRLAVGAGVAAGEVVWLVGELELADSDAELLQEAGVAVAAMESCLTAVARAVQEVAERGASIEVTASAEALGRIGAQLGALLPRLQHV